MTRILQEVFSSTFQVIDKDADVAGDSASNAVAKTLYTGSLQLGLEEGGGGGGDGDSRKQRKAGDAGLSDLGALGKKPKSGKQQLPSDTLGVPGFKTPQKSVCVCPQAVSVFVFAFEIL